MFHAQRRFGLKSLAGGALGSVGLTLVLLTALGCQNSKPQASPIVDRGPMYSGARIFHGTVGSLAQFTNDEPMLVSGYGLVVGLQGSGSPEVLPYLKPYMIDQVRRGGVSSASAFSMDSAVVSVQGLIAPGASVGDPFDLWVESTSGAVTSLAGGRLFTSDLQPGAPTRDLEKFIGRAATGGGVIYTDPLDQKGWEKHAIAGVSWQDFQRQGLVLGGGRVEQSRPITLTLNQPSYSVVGHIVAAINSRFELGPQDKLPVAEGHDEQHISINIPHAFQRDPGAFIETIRWLYIQRLDPSFAPEQAKVMLAALAEELPARREAFANQCVQAWKGLDRGVLPLLRPAYTLAPGSALERELWPNEVRKPNDPKAAARLNAARQGYAQVRDAAVRAGMMLGDPAAIDILVLAAEQTQNSEAKQRLAGLLATQPNNQGVLAALRLLMADKDIPVRMAAYEAYTQCLARLADKMGGGEMGSQAAEKLMGNFHRTFAYDKDQQPRYALDVVSIGDPLVVMSVSGRPRVVIFGKDAGLKNPTDVWFEGAQSATNTSRQSASQRAAAVKELAADAHISQKEAQARLDALDAAAKPVAMSGQGRLNLRVRNEQLSEEMRDTVARQIKAERGIPFADAYKMVPQTREILAFSFYPGNGTKQEFKAVNNIATLVFSLGQHTGAKYARPGLSFEFDKVTHIIHELSTRGAIAAPVEIYMSPLAAYMRKAALNSKKPDAARPDGVEDLSGLLGAGAKPKTPLPKPADKAKGDAPVGENPFKQ